jgi:hypothetical protein
MSKRHGIREQKRLAKQKAKRHAKRRNLAMRNSPNPSIRLLASDRWLVNAALVPDNLWSSGIGNLVIARSMPDGRLACGVFLLDVFCLGVKDATWKILSPAEFKDLRKHVGEHGRLEDVPPEYFAKLIYRAVDYSQSLGFPPHRDFRHASRLLAGIDPSLCFDDFEFGQNGRPHYIRGPSESLEKSHAIAKRIAALGGDYTIPLGSADLSDFELIDEFDDGFDDDEFEDDEFEDDDFEDDELPKRRSISASGRPADEFEEGSANQAAINDEKQVPRRRWWLPRR